MTARTRRIGIRNAPTRGEAIFANNVDIFDTITGDSLKGVCEVNVNIRAGELVTAKLLVEPEFLELHAELVEVVLRTHEEVDVKELGDDFPLNALTEMLHARGFVLARRREQ